MYSSTLGAVRAARVRQHAEELALNRYLLRRSAWKRAIFNAIEAPLGAGMVGGAIKACHVGGDTGSMLLVGLYGLLCGLAILLPITGLLQVRSLRRHLKEIDEMDVKTSRRKVANL